MLAASGVIAGCGMTATTPIRVHLHVAAPADGTRIFAQSITVSGSVSPATASVMVLGRSVAVDGGSFSAQIQLAPGINLVDVLAGAPDAQEAMNVVRVFRELPVTVPSVSGDASSAAVTALKALGLVPRVHDTDGGLDFLLPVPRQACSTNPPAGQGVAPGSTVALTVSKFC